MTKRKLGPVKKGPPKGKTNNPSGRTVGSKNKVTADARKAITLFVEGNIGQLNKWLKKIERDTGANAAFYAFMSVVEYHIPKLNRTTLVGEEDKPVGVLIVDNIPRPPSLAGRSKSKTSKD